MRSPKQIAIDITNGDTEAKAELEKMMGKSFELMSIEKRRFGVACLSAFDGQWQNKKAAHV